jgi:hypothetical protein
MPSRRTKSISTKVTADEYSQLAALAGEETISEWARRVLLRAALPAPGETAVLAELLALRAILLNLQFASQRGEPLTPEAMQRLIERADQDKTRHAEERLTSIVGRQS